MMCANDQHISKLIGASYIDHNKNKEKNSKKERLPSAIALKDFEQRFQNSAPFRKAWKEWFDHRREIKKTLTPTTLKKQMKFLQLHTVPDAVKIIKRSIMNGWTGLFELNGDGRGATPANVANVDEDFDFTETDGAIVLTNEKKGETE